MTSNLETLLGKLEVTQADRDAAADFWSLTPSMKWMDWQEGWLRDGAGDTGPVVQAFARHRLATIRDLSARVETARGEALEEAAKVSESVIEIIGAAPGSSIHSALTEAASAIRALKESRHG